MRRPAYSSVVRSPPRLLPSWLTEAALLLGLGLVRWRRSSFAGPDHAAILHGRSIVELATALLAVGALAVRRRHALAVLALIGAIALAEPDTRRH